MLQLVAENICQAQLKSYPSAPVEKPSPFEPVVSRSSRLARYLLEGSIDAEAGVVHQHLDLQPEPLDLLDHPLTLVPLGEIGGHGLSPDAMRVAERVGEPLLPSTSAPSVGASAPAPGSQWERRKGRRASDRG